MTPSEQLVQKYGSVLAERQIQLEIEGSELGTANFDKQLEKAMEEKDVNGIQAYSWIFREGVPLVAQAIETWRTEASGPKGGRKSTLLRYIESMDAKVVAYITLRATLTAFMGKPMTNTVVSRKIGLDLDTQFRAERLKAEYGRAYQGAIEEGLKQRHGDHVKRAYLQAWERRLEVEEDGRNEADLIKVGMHLLSIALQATGLGHLQRVSSGSSKVQDTSLVLSMSPEFAKRADRINMKLAEMATVHLPTVVPPNPWTHWMGGGYYTEHTRPILFVRAPLAVVKSVYNELDLTPVYEAVNRIQETPWAINTRVLDVAQEILSWKRNVIDAYPCILGEDPPEKPHDIDSNPEARLAYRKQAFEHYQKMDVLGSKRRRVASVLSQGQKFRDDEAIYFPHNLDFRGRIYATTLLNPQGDDLMKGILKFSSGVPLGLEGAKWLAIHGANCAGVDKVSFDERLAWIEAHEEVILNCARQPFEELFWTTVDCPFGFLAFCFEWEGFKLKGSEFVSHIPVAFDGSCSGLQHFSAMLKDEIGGSAVNLTPTETPSDIYRMVAEKVIKQLEADVAHGSSDEFVEKVYDKGTESENSTTVLQLGSRTCAERWLAYGITRSETKRSVMTLAYGSREYGFAEQIMIDIIRPSAERGKTHFWPTPGEKSQMARYLAAHIWTAVGSVVVKAVEAMNWLQTAASLLGSQGLPVRWTTPAGFTVWQEYRKRTTQRVETVFGASLIRGFDGEKENRSESAGQADKGVKEGDVRVRVQISHFTPDIDKVAQKNGISPNFIHSMDASHLMQTVVAGAKQGIRSFAMIHDSFGTHAGNSGKFFKIIREEFVRTYIEQDVLAVFAAQVSDQLDNNNVKKLPMIPCKGSLEVSGVNESLYAFA
ncbi:DNA-directed RNA polymerase [Pseudomonas chlororaphis subsp. piscium]|uniref:DNA-directed RNA polymerase n=1 Tax=Pseudomonas chlororaphis TaxID=587753 RepID=UPI000F55FC4C|nr:DNA-directed RNA polymerase [Pseudomonas chlororaphis]AZC49519.1 DNA-directed RNA polymerase [Pseudomonas chlororaphis subsp. piscium]